MKKTKFALSAALLAISMMTACVGCENEDADAKYGASTDTPKFANPIYSLTASNSSTRVGEADPWVYKHSDGYYYYCASYGSTFTQIQLRRARTIDLLDSNDEAEVATIITPASGNFANIKAYLWAPELQYIDGTWYLFFTAVPNTTTETNDTWSSAASVWGVKNYIAKCTDTDPLTGTWTLAGRMRAVTGSTLDETALDSSADESKMDITKFRYAGDGNNVWLMNLDGTAFKVGDQWYYAWAENLYDGGWADEGEPDDGVLTFGGVDHTDGAGSGAWSSIIIGKVVEGSDFTRITNATPVTAPQYGWECGKTVYDEYGNVNSFEMTHSPYVNVNEGPAVLVRNGKVFLVFSASACDASYCLGMLTADQSADLCDATSWTKSEKPVFTSSVKNGIYGPGHCSFTTYKGYDVIVYHARTWPWLYSYYGRTNNYTTASEGLQDPYRTGRAKVFGWNADGSPNFGVAE